MAALGQNGTTGGAGGPVVTATSSSQVLDYLDTVGPLVIQVSGRIAITVDGSVDIVRGADYVTGANKPS